MLEEKIEKSPQTIQYLKKIKKENRKKIIKQHKIIVSILGAFLLLVLIFCISIGIWFLTVDKIDSVCMSSTLKVGDRVNVDESFGKIERGKVYKFEKDGEIYYQRCIGIPGDNIRVENDNVYVNSMLFSEGYVSSKMKSLINIEVNIPEEKYFFMGDNRNKSVDGRYWADKFVDEKDIIGEVTEVVYPFNRAKEITYY